MSLLLIAISLLPVVLLLVFIYRQDKYEKEPVGLLIRAFVGGMVAIPLDLTLVSLINTVFYSESVFFTAFIEAGFCEELCKFVILFLTIWWNRNFNEHMDGIVYATFVGLGFACVENVLYVMQAASTDLAAGFSTGIVRALLSVPGHFLFAIVMGYFLSLAKFSEQRRFGFLLLCLFAPALIHGLFDWLLMAGDFIHPALALVLLALFIWGDIRLWKLGIRLIRRHQENSPFKDQTNNDVPQAEAPPVNSMSNPYSNEPEYKHIDWNAGNKY